MDLLEIEGMVGIPSPQISHISPFSEIIDRDSSEEQRQAAKELCYIHHMVHYDSSYAQYTQDRRHEKLVKDIWGKDRDWEPDELVKQGVKKYKELTQSEYIRLLESARSTANKLIDHFNNLEIEDPKEAKDAIANVSKIGEVVEGIDKLKEQIEKNQAKKNANRAGVETNKYSE